MFKEKMRIKVKEYNLYSYGFDDSKLYATRNALKKAEQLKFEIGQINWEGFDRLVAITKKDIEKQLENFKEIEPKPKKIKPKPKKLVYAICAYNLTTFELIGAYSSVAVAASELHLSAKSIENSVYKRNGIYKKGNMKFMRKYI